MTKKFNHASCNKVKLEDNWVRVNGAVYDVAAYLCVCVRACVGACVRVCARACVRACMCVCKCVCVCVSVCV